MPKIDNPLRNQVIDLTAKGLSQLEISRALGVTQGYVSKLLQGKHSVIVARCTCKTCPIHGKR